MAPGIDTLAVHAGQPVDSDTLSRALPIYQTTSYVFRDTDHAASLFALEAPGNIYTRLTNPTTEVLEKRLAAMHGAGSALAAASGQSAAFFVAAALAGAGQNFVASPNLYGGTITLFSVALKRFGIECRFADGANPENFARASDENTRFYYLESVANPGANIDDLDAIAALAHARGLPMVVDNTFTPPPIFNPFDHGADILVYSLTKMIGGHGTSIGGAVVEKGAFDWRTEGRFPEIASPDPAYHGVDFYKAFGAAGAALTAKIRCCWLRDIGACLSPFNAWLFVQGLETLPLRARRHCENAKIVAEWLAADPRAAWVEYPGLPSHRDHARAKAYMPLGPGAVFGFGVKGGYEAGRKFINAAKLASHVANVLDAKTLVIHPASTTHQQLTDEQRRKGGVRPEMVRFSAGLEDAGDIIADLDQALAEAVK